MADSAPSETLDLLAYVEESPTPWHAVQETRERLERAGFQEVLETDATWDDAPGSQRFVVREGGSIVAWRRGTQPAVDAGFRVIGAHTDSPNLRLKSRPDVTREGFGLLGVQTYGGVLLHTWFDRDLSLAGRVTVRTDDGFSNRLVRIDRPLCRIPNLAIHLNREIRKDGFQINEQKHLPAVWSMEGSTRGVAGLMAEELGVDEDQVLGWDLCLYDVQPPTVGGLADEFIFCPRLDNLASSHAGLSALLGAEATEQTQVVALFDHEEIGSRTTRGANGSLTRDILRRLVDDGDLGFARAAGRSMMVSADMAHGVHPNYADKHEPEHKPMLNGGPVVKAHADWKYATESESAAIFRGLCRDVDVPVQEFVTRSDLACGSTIGPIVASSLGMRTVDVGNAMWSMHSIREMAGSQDHPQMIAAMGGFLAWNGR